MRSTTALPSIQYPCPCGTSHPVYARLPTPIIICPDLKDDDTLRVILGTPIVLRTGKK